MAVLRPPAPIACVSPHLDDAVLSCGQVLGRHPGASVVTLFAGAPDAAWPLTPWDRDGGFESGTAAMAARFEEDRRATAALSATPVHLPYLDAQYRQGPPPPEASSSLAAALGDGPLLVPLGLSHEDHEAAHRITMEVLARSDRRPLAFYEDCPYRTLDDGRLRDEAVAALRRVWPVSLHVVDSREAVARKAAAVQAYRSQIRALDRRWPGAIDDACRPERYWVVGDDGAWL
jgi:LmbE family N-acetylglucosaminyl deacetylase